MEDCTYYTYMFALNHSLLFLGTLDLPCPSIQSSISTNFLFFLIRNWYYWWQMFLETRSCGSRSLNVILETPRSFRTWKVQISTFFRIKVPVFLNLSSHVDVIDNKCFKRQFVSQGHWKGQSCSKHMKVPNFNIFSLKSSHLFSKPFIRNWS
jgi:hypothetical protein